MNFESWLMRLKFLATENGIRALLPKDESLLRDAFDCGWSTEMALDDICTRERT